MAYGTALWRVRRQRDAVAVFARVAALETTSRTLAAAARYQQARSLVAAGDKRHARLTVLKTFCDRLEEKL